MNEFVTKVKDSLFQLVHDMSEVSYLFSQNPESDFTRNRKLDFKTFLRPHIFHVLH